jgi:hypothetical protein
MSVRRLSPLDHRRQPEARRYPNRRVKNRMASLRRGGTRGRGRLGANVNCSCRRRRRRLLAGAEHNRHGATTQDDLPAGIAEQLHWLDKRLDSYVQGGSTWHGRRASAAG